MGKDVGDIAKWAQSQGWTVEVDSKSYTRFYNAQGEYVTNYPATPSRPYRRMQDLKVNLRKAGLPWPPPSKKEQRSQRRKENPK